MTENTPNDDAVRTKRIMLGLAAAVLAVTMIFAVAMLQKKSPESNEPNAQSSSTPSSSQPDGQPSSSSSTPSASASASQSPSSIEKSPVGLDKMSEPVSGIQYTLSKLESVDGEARGPGEVAGPALRFRLTVKNTGQKTLALDTLVVNVNYGSEKTPASDLSGPGKTVFPAKVDEGQQVEAVYVFKIPKDQRHLVRILVDQSVGVPISVFEGEAP